jgi:DNA adenine methylase
MSKYKVPFPWYGGKCSRLKWLLPIINNIEHIAYVEPFGGSGAVLFNKPISQVEVYNDVYGDVVNFFRVLRNNTEEIIKLLSLTPYSREEFGDSTEDTSKLSDIEMARLFFVRARQVRSSSATNCNISNWSYVTSNTRRGISQNTSRWLSGIEGLPEFAERLLLVQIENKKALDVISRYDTETTLFYLDPPYTLDTRSQKAYSDEMSTKDHIELLDLIVNIKGKVIISGYPNNLYETHLSGWYTKEFEENLGGYEKSDKSKRIEKIWSNVLLNNN